VCSPCRPSHAEGFARPSSANDKQGDERIGEDDEVCVHVAWFGFGIGVCGRGGADSDGERNYEYGSGFHGNFHGWQLAHHGFGQ